MTGAPETADGKLNSHELADENTACREIRRRYRTIGVTGHIDHGKTSLVKALTGVDTDTHPEEKRRGITIDLGFASFQCGDYQFALIDAPGHQKYIGNLLAGMAGVDLGLLIVACDQGLQEQTFEHAFILKTLSVTEIIVVLTRRDLVDAHREQDVRDEVELLLDDLGFRDARIVSVSSVTGDGLENLKTALCEKASRQTPQAAGPWFRMPIDRILNMPGRGCVLGGTVWSGSVSVGDILTLASTGTQLRVRDLQRHGVAGVTSVAGLRTAINVTGDVPQGLHRGDELLEPGRFSTSNRLIVELETRFGLPDLSCPLTIQLHTATTSCSVRLLGQRKITAKKTLVAVIETEHPVVAIWGQRFLARLPYPIGTFGGGRILAALPDPTNTRQRTKSLIELGQKLQSPHAVDRLTAWVDELKQATASDPWLETAIGLNASDALESATEKAQLIDIAVKSGRVICLETQEKQVVLLSAAAVTRASNDILKIMHPGHKTAGSRTADNIWRAESSVIEQLKTPAGELLLRYAIEDLLRRGNLIRLSNMIAISGNDQMTARQRQTLDTILQLYENNRTPPTHTEAATNLSISEPNFRSLSRFALQSGLLIDIGSNIYYWKATFDQLCQELQIALTQTPELPVSAIRDHWSITRKHAIPLLEYLDKVGVTKRNGDLRLLPQQSWGRSGERSKQGRGPSIN